MPAHMTWLEILLGSMLSRSFKCNSTIDPCFAQLGSWSFAIRGQGFYVGQNLVQSLLIQFFRTLSQLKHAMFACQFILFLVTCRTWRIVNHNTKAKTKTNKPTRNGNYKGKMPGCSIVVLQASMSLLSDKRSWSFYVFVQYRQLL